MAFHRKMASRQKMASPRKWLLPENGFSPENNFSPGNEEFLDIKLFSKSSPHITKWLFTGIWLLARNGFSPKMANSWTDIELFCKFFPQKIKKMKNYFLRLSLSQGTAFSALYGT